jgi:DNA-binding beta-propeller fold protein YncE
MRRVFLFLAALSSIQSLVAQPSGVSGPTEGFTFDAPTKSIRAVIGSLGSASLGPALLNQLDFASVAPRQNYGVAFRRGQFFSVSQMGATHVSEASLQAPSFAPEGVIWSNDGSVAVLYSQTGIQTYSGFPASANAGSSISISPLGGSLSAAATDIHGQNVAIGITGDHAGIYVSTNGQGFVPLLSIPSPVGLTFSADGGTLYALDGSSNQVSEINLASSAVQVWPLGTEDAVGIISATNALSLNVLYVAARSDRLLLAFDTSTHQQIASIPLSFTPTAIVPLGINSFLLGSRSGTSDPLWSFRNGSQPTVYFVPATPLPNDLEPSREVRPR